MPDLQSIERLWWSNGLAARIARTALLPLEAVYRGVVHTRGVLYDRGVFASRTSPIPTISIGNLTVGGTGKTPVAAWTVAQLEAMGAKAAVVLRGYGEDEPMVHQALNPHAPVVVAPDRVRGIEEAAALGADVAVLDDAFQHRRAQRDVDIVLLSADRWGHRPRLIPAGPFREPMSAVRRASLVLVTRKASSHEQARQVLDDLRAIAPELEGAIAHLELAEVRQVGSDRRKPVSSLAGARVLAIAAVGDPRAFVRQLTAIGAEVRFSIFPDHHAFTAGDAELLARSIEPGERAVCTLKDAVKLAPVWPRGARSLWYVSQQVVVEQGADALQSLLSSVVTQRTK